MDTLCKQFSKVSILCIHEDKTIMVLLQKVLDYYFRDFQNVYLHLIQNISNANEQNMSSSKYFSINCTAEESCKKFFVTGPQIYIVR